MINYINDVQDSNYNFLFPDIKYDYVDDFSELKGKTFSKVYQGIFEDNDALFFENDNEKYVLGHGDNECCEYVYLEDICGYLSDLENTEILFAEETSNQTGDQNIGTETWTYYKLATIKGWVTLRFYGMSNGFYSEKVSLHKFR